MEKIEVFFEVAEILNTELQIAPLLFGSLGLEQRLGCKTLKAMRK